MIEGHHFEDTHDLYQNAPCGYITIGNDGRILNINNTLLSWLDFRKDEVVGKKTFQDLLGMGEKIYFESHFMPLLQLQEEVSEINMELRGNNESRLPVLINAKKVPASSDEQTRYRLSALDMTQRKKYEKELITARKEAEETTQLLKQVNENLESFVNVASHDLKTPLSNISSIIYLIEDQNLIEPGSQAEELFAGIKKNISRMTGLIHDLLEFSKIQNDPDSITYEPIDLNQACKEALDILDHEIQKTGAVFHIPELPPVMGSKVQFESLFLNLFTNALKYRSEAAPVVSVTWEQTGTFNTIRITDNGTGFDPGKKDEIFEFMKRVHSKDYIEGTGIGLTICKRVVENHGGCIGAESEPGKGSTFWFTLPVVDEDEFF